MADPTSPWNATSRSPAAGTERIPVDTSDSSGPGYLTVDNVLTRGGIDTFGITRGSTRWSQGEITESGVNVARLATTAVLGSSVHFCPSGNNATLGGRTGILLGGRSAGGDTAGRDIILSPDPAVGTAAGARARIVSAPAGTGAVNVVAQPLLVIDCDERQVANFTKPIAELTGSRYAEADESVTSSTTLVSHSDLQCDVLSGRTYPVSAAFTVTCGAVGGLKVALGGPAITSARWQITITDTATGAVVADSFADLSSSLTAVGGTEYLVRIDGMVRPSADGTVSVQFAQQTSDGTATTIKSLGGARFCEAF